MGLMLFPWVETRVRKVASGESALHAVVDVGLRMLGIAGLVLAAAVTVYPPQTSPAQVNALHWVYGLGAALAVFNVLDVILSRREKGRERRHVRDAVREGMTEANRHALFMDVIDLTYKIDELTYEYDLKIKQKIGGSKLSDGDRVRAISEGRKVMVDDFNRNLWRDVVSAVSEAKQFPYVHIDELDFIDQSRFGISSTEDISRIFATLDNISTQLRHPTVTL